MLPFSHKLQKQKKIKQLIRNGVPPDLRGEVWWICSGANEKMQSTSPLGQFGALVQRSPELYETEVEFDIQKDLGRTFPWNSWISSPQGEITSYYIISYYIK